MTVVTQTRVVGKEDHMQRFHILFAHAAIPPLHSKSPPHLALAVMMQRVRARMIQDRREEIEGVAKMIYKERQAQGSHQQQTDGFADWVEAENRVIRSTFERQTGCTLSLTASMLVGLLPLSLDLPPQPESSDGKVGAITSCCCKHHNALSKYVLMQSSATGNALLLQGS